MSIYSKRNPKLKGYEFSNVDIFQTKEFKNNVAKIVSASVKVTYSEIKALYDSQTLVPYAWYEITDFRSIMYVPGQAFTNIDVRGDDIPEHSLLVQAVSKSEVNPIVIDTEFPDDLVYYDITGEQGGLSYPANIGKGWIYYRMTNSAAVYTTGYKWNKNEFFGFDPRACVQILYACDLSTEGASAISHCLLKPSLTSGFDSTGTFISRVALDTDPYDAVTNTDGYKCVFMCGDSREMAQYRNTYFKIRFSGTSTTYGVVPYFYADSCVGVRYDGIYDFLFVGAGDASGKIESANLCSASGSNILLYSNTSPHPFQAILSVRTYDKLKMHIIGGGYWVPDNDLVGPNAVTFINSPSGFGMYLRNTKIYWNYSTKTGSQWQVAGRVLDSTISLTGGGGTSMHIQNVGQGIPIDINQGIEALVPVTMTTGGFLDGISANSITKAYNCGGTTPTAITLSGTDKYSGIIDMTNGSAGVTLITLSGSVKTETIIIRNNTGFSFNLGTGGNFKFAPTVPAPPLTLVNGGEIMLKRSGSNWLIG